MASRIMHLAIADKILESIKINNINSFKIGTILPDAYKQATSHFKIKVLNNTKLTYDLTGFRNTYKSELLSNDLYLGYYIHLVGDLFYRHFVYDKHHWDPMPEGNVQKLHNDYKLLNKYVVDKYKITDDIEMPIDLENEEIFKAFPFDAEGLLCDLKTDFYCFGEGDAFFFTSEMADEYIEETTKRCVEEIDALRKNKTTIDECEFAWNVHK